MDRQYNASVLELDGTVVRDLSNLQYAEGLNVDSDPGNQGTPSFVSVRGCKPVLSASTRQLATVLGKLDSGCAWADVAEWNDPFKAFWQKRANTQGLLAGTGAHRSMSVAAGLMVARRLSASYQQYAGIDFEMVPSASDGQTNPVTLAENASLPSLGLDDERFTLGTSTVGSEALAGCTDFEIDFGVGLDAVGADSDVFDSYISVLTYAPRFTWRGINPEWLAASAIPLGGKAATKLNTTIYLRKCADRGKLVAAATAEHIKINAAGYVYVENNAASGNANATCSVVLVVANDGTNPMITIDVASAIS